VCSNVLECSRVIGNAHEDFQARPHSPAWMNDLLASVMIYSLRSIDLHLCFRIRTHSHA
jgi:hypothetical protein